MLTFRVKPFGFGLDSVGTELGLLAVDRGAAEGQLNATANLCGRMASWPILLWPAPTTRGRASTVRPSSLSAHRRGRIRAIRAVSPRPVGRSCRMRPATSLAGHDSHEILPLAPFVPSCATGALRRASGTQLTSSVVSVALLMGRKYWQSQWHTSLGLFRQCHAGAHSLPASTDRTNFSRPPAALAEPVAHSPQVLSSLSPYR